MICDASIPQWRLVITPTAVGLNLVYLWIKGDKFPSVIADWLPSGSNRPAEHGHHHADGAESGPAATTSTVTGSQCAP